MRIQRLCILVGVLFAAGCTALTGAGTLDGAWTETSTFPGNSLKFTLNTNGDAVTGSGTWTGEACCDGVVSIAGNASGADVHLTFTFVTNGGSIPARTTPFTGKVMLGGMIVGKFGSDATSPDVAFQRTK